MNNLFIKKIDAINYYNNLKDKNNYKLFQEDINVAHSKTFYVCKPEKIYNNILSNNNAHYYEFWTDKMGIKFSVDIDFNIKTNINIDELLINIINIIIAGAKKYYNYIYNIKDIIILENDKIQQQIENPIKYSAHIIFNGLTFQNHLIAKDFFLRLNKDYNISKYNVDKSIYNLTCLRLLWCSKMGKNAKLMPKILDINNEKTAYPSHNKYNRNKYNFFLDSMITNINSNDKIIKECKYSSIEKTLKSIDNIDNINIDGILMNLPFKYCDEYDYWINIGMILHSYNNDDNNMFNLWNEWSKKSNKYKAKEMVNKWKSFNKNTSKLKIGTLIKWARDAGYNNIYKTNNLTIDYKVNMYPIKPIQLDISNNDIITILNEPKLEINNILNLLNKKLLCIQSEKGTGKTTNLFEALFNYSNIINSDTKILVVSCRITFSYKILGDLKKYGFSIYHDYKDYHIEANKIVCQFDSLARLNISDYDIVIIDECESLARYITSSHYTKNPKADLTLEIFQTLVTEAKHVYIMDADLSDRCIYYYKNLINLNNIDEMHILVNNYRPCNEYTIKYSHKETWLKEVIIAAIENKKIVIASASNSKAKDLYKLLEIKLEGKDKKILIINRETEEEKKKNLLLNVNQTWIEYDIIIYTPSVCMGVSFDIDNYFDNIYVYGCSNSLGAQELCQMIHRIRKPKNKIIYLTVDEYKEYDDKSDEITYELVEKMLCSDYYLTHHDLHNNLIKKKINNQKIEIVDTDNIDKFTIKYEKMINYPFKNDPIYDLYVRNAKERIENNLNFTACLFGYIKYREYKLEYLISNDTNSDKELWSELLDLKTERTEKEKEEKINGIYNADDIIKDEYLNLIQKHNDYITQEDIYKIYRYNLINCYHIEDKETITEDFISEYFDKDKMKHYRNLNTIKSTKEQNTFTKLQILKNNEQFDSNIANCYINFNNKNKYTYHYYAIEIINTLGFDINDLTIEIKLDNNFIENINKTIIFCNNNKYEIAYKYNLKIKHKSLIDLDCNKKIKYLNNILNEQYGIQIKKIKGIKDNELYKLEDNNIWETIELKPINLKEKNKTNNNYDSSFLDIFEDD